MFKQGEECFNVDSSCVSGDGRFIFFLEDDGCYFAVSCGYFGKYQVFQPGCCVVVFEFCGEFVIFAGVFFAGVCYSFG